MVRRTWVLATHNAGKCAEFVQACPDPNIEWVAQFALGIPPVAETGLSFIENALLKARHAARCSGLPALADDSGLCVDALGGAPGLFSARYAGPHASDADNNRKLLQELAGVPESRRGAHFYGVIAFVRGADDPTPWISEGSWRGCILEQPRGQGGFGYDPLFFDPVHARSAAELDVTVKNRISHRGQAWAAFWKRWCDQQALEAGACPANDRS